MDVVATGDLVKSFNHRSGIHLDVAELSDIYYKTEQHLLWEDAKKQRRSMKRLANIAIVNNSLYDILSFNEDVVLEEKF